MTDSDDWSTNANTAIQITLKHRNRKRDVDFNPAFTYPIFGEEEAIFGYEGLKIRFDYAADTLEPARKITWDKQYQQIGETKADNIEELLADFLPEVSPPGLKVGGKSSAPFSPPGELIHQYEVEGRKFGIWSSPLAVQEASQLVENIQIFITFFVEGGTFLELNDPDWTIDRWTVFFLYAIDTEAHSAHPSYSFAGYATTYRLFFFDAEYSSGSSLDPASSVPMNASLTSNLPCRQRISQFLILPPYQENGHGSHLYSTMFSSFFSNPTTREITVEDPNEAFDDMRDYNDLLRLRGSDASFASLRVDSSAALPSARTKPLPTSLLLNGTAVASIRQRSKIAPRQFDRLVEMQLLSAIPASHRSTSRITRKDKSKDADDRAYYYWRLLVKQRLYKHNVDTLAQLDPGDRIDKLEETIAGVEKDYLRILDGAAARNTRGGMDIALNKAAGNGTVETKEQTSFGKSRVPKRKIVDEEDDDDSVLDGGKLEPTEWEDIAPSKRSSKDKGGKRKAEEAPRSSTTNGQGKKRAKS